MKRAREFFLCDETDNSGWSVREWNEKEEKRQRGACNVIHVREVLPDEQSKIELLEKKNAIMRDALDEVSFPSHPDYSNCDTICHNQIAEKALKEIEGMDDQR